MLEPRLLGLCPTTARNRVGHHDGRTDTERPDPSTLDVHELDRAEVELEREYHVSSYRVARGDEPRRHPRPTCWRGGKPLTLVGPSS